MTNQHWCPGMALSLLLGSYRALMFVHAPSQTPRLLTCHVARVHGGKRCPRGGVVAGGCQVADGAWAAGCTAKVAQSE